MGLEPFQGRAHDILAKGPPSDVSTSPDRSLEQNENNGNESHKAALNSATGSSSLLPPLTKDEIVINDRVLSTVQAYSVHSDTPKISPQNMPQYRNVFNERAKRGFCYWLIEKKAPACKGYCLGAYKTSLGLPKV